MWPHFLYSHFCPKIRNWMKLHNSISENWATKKDRATFRLQILNCKLLVAINRIFGTSNDQMILVNANWFALFTTQIILGFFFLWIRFNGNLFKCWIHTSIQFWIEIGKTHSNQIIIIIIDTWKHSCLDVNDVLADQWLKCLKIKIVCTFRTCIHGVSSRVW